MWKWFRRNWRERQAGAISDLVWSTNEIAPGWEQIQVHRRPDGTLVLSVTSAGNTTVSTLSPT